MKGQLPSPTSGPTSIGPREITPEVWETLSEQFLELVAVGTPASRAADAVGASRNTFYERAARLPEFQRRWELARRQARQDIADTVLDKALIVTGHIIEEPLYDPSTGDPVLNEDFEVVTVRRLRDFDSRILSKLIDRFVPSEDGAPQTNVAVQTNVAMSERPRKKPQLVYPS